MFSELLTYDPNDVNPKYREQMAALLKARSEILAASAEVAALRARAWAGEPNLDGIIELKALDLAAVRHDYSAKMVPFLKEVVDLEHFKGLVPMLVMVVLQGLKVPLPVVFESIGVDFDQFQLLAEQLKNVINDL